MTIDERASVLIATLPLRMVDADEPEVRNRIRTALLETARDQREACVKAVDDIPGACCELHVYRADALSAIANTELVK